MELAKNDNFRLEVKLNAHPDIADLAITSIDVDGNLGELNSFVLDAYGYNSKDLPSKEILKRGYCIIYQPEKKNIYFVVTIDGKRPPKILLEENLKNLLNEFKGNIEHQKVWIPLLATGSAGLSYEDSYTIISKVIGDFWGKTETNTQFIISFPDDNEGKRVYGSLKVPTNELDESDYEPTRAYLINSSDISDKSQLKRNLSKGVFELELNNEFKNPLFNKVRRTDVLVVKVDISGSSSQILTIIAIGVVIRVLQAGKQFAVNWCLPNLNLRPKKIIDDGSNIKEIKAEEFDDFFDLLTENQKELLENTIEKPEPQAETLPGIISDNTDGEDYLDISNDVNAFARLIAAKSFKPPLAIALFGNWGSGKSFFMGKLKNSITNYATNNQDGTYCEGVVQIHFNAWSYIDANLWASLVSRIFDELLVYIKDTDNVKKQEETVRKQLVDNLNITKQSVIQLEIKKESIEEQIKILKYERNRIKNKLDNNISRIRTNTLKQILEETDNQFNAKQKIEDAFRENETFCITAKELEKIIPEQYRNDPKATYEIIKSRYTFLKVFFNKKNIYKNLLWLVGILLIIFLTPYLLDELTNKISDINFLIPQIYLTALTTLGVYWKRAEEVYKELQPVIAKYWKIKESHEEKIAEAKAQFEQNEKALKLEIEKDRIELEQIGEQLQKEELLKTELEFKIANALSTETLYQFIEERSITNDYKKHLGIISIIRKDFEILSALFTNHKTDLIENENVSAFKKLFAKKLERIVLYIDDLDRCPEENVVQVLEAVNLLMAFPLFVVVVGVDQRWVKNALLQRYSKQFGSFDNTEKIGVTTIEPDNYLEKIFQIPFHLKSAGNNTVKQMIKNLAGQKIGTTTTMPTTNEEKANVEIDLTVTSEINKENGNSTIISEGKTEGILLKKLFEKEKPQQLELTENEITLMQEMADIVGNNPRALKRYVNIYRVIKIHKDFEYNEEDILIILFLIALPLGPYAALTSLLFSRNINMEVSVENLEKLINTERKIINNPQNKLHDNLLGAIHSNEILMPLAEKAFFKFEKYTSFIKRFSFKQ